MGLTGDGMSLWFDKCLTIQMFEHTTVALANMEHSGTDATVSLNFSVQKQHSVSATDTNRRLHLCRSTFELLKVDDFCTTRQPIGEFAPFQKYSALKSKNHSSLYDLSANFIVRLPVHTHKAQRRFSVKTTCIIASAILSQYTRVTYGRQTRDRQTDDTLLQ